MAKPIPINKVGLQRGRYYFDAAALAPAWDAPPQLRPAPPAITPVRAPFRGEALLLVSGLTGGLAIAFTLGQWPLLTTTDLGLDTQGAYYLTVVGIYLLASTLYAAWRTRLLHDVQQSPWNARLMAYANVVVGAGVALILGVIAFAVVGIVVVLVLLAALLFSGVGGPEED